MSAGLVVLTDFVATAFNCWGRGSTPQAAVKALLKQVNAVSGGRRKLTIHNTAWVNLPKKVWGSDQRINVTAGVYLRVDVPNDATLVEFNY